MEAGIADKEELGLTEYEEGEEPEVFWIALGKEGEEDYGSLLQGKRRQIIMDKSINKHCWSRGQTKIVG